MIERGPSRLRFFSSGLGDPDELAWFESEATRVWPVKKLSIDWDEPSTKGGVIFRHGSFASPFDFLPDRAQAGRVKMIEPLDGAEHCVVILAAWNDHSFDTRTAIGVRLAEVGIATLVP